jgi:membrane-associated phospholipid phosphatase
VIEKYKALKGVWVRAFVADRKIYWKMAFLFALGNAAPTIMIWTFQAVQARPGIHLNDPILELLPVRDMSVTIFTILYSTLAVSVISILGSPKRVIVAMKLYVVLSYLRMASTYLVALEPPDNLILLTDPILNAWVYAGNIITKDLFFSGHTSTLVCCFMAVENKYLKWAVGIGASIVSVLLLVQRVHYSIDIIAGWIICYLCFKIITSLPAKHL